MIPTGRRVPHAAQLQTYRRDTMLKTTLIAAIAALSLMAAPMAEAKKGGGKAKAEKTHKVKNFPSKAPKGKQ